MKYLRIRESDIQVIEANTFFKRFRGLMGQDLAPDHAMLLTPCNSIHTCFMKFPIDVVFLNREYAVVDLMESMQPWRCSRTVPKAKHVLEMRAGTMKRLGIETGMQLDIAGEREDK